MTLPKVLAAIASRLGDRKGVLAIVGAVARNAWAPPRATTDLDLAVSATGEVLEAIRDALTSAGFRPVRRQQADAEDPFPDLLVFRSQESSPKQVDLLVAKTAFEAEVLRRAVRIEVCDVEIPVATPEDVVVYKLIADRHRDREDILAVLRTQARAGRRVDWHYIGRWAKYWHVDDRLEAVRAQLRGQDNGR